MLFTATFTNYQSCNSTDRRISVDLFVEDSLAQIEIGGDVVVCSKFNFNVIQQAKYLAKVSCQLVDKSSETSGNLSTFSGDFLHGCVTYIAPNKEDGLEATLFFTVPIETKEFDQVFDSLVKNDLVLKIDIDISDLSFGWRPDGSDLKWETESNGRGWDRKPLSSVKILLSKGEEIDMKFHSDALPYLPSTSSKPSEKNVKLALVNLIFEHLKQQKYYFLLIIILLALVAFRV